MIRLTGLALPDTLAEYRPFPPADDRAAWKKLPEQTRARLLAEGERHLGFEIPFLYATDWLAYSQTGNRTGYEEKYFARRRALSALVLAECTEDGGRFLPDILNLLAALCEESAWQLPAHNSYERDTPALPLPDTRRPLLDLFACETGAVLATTLYLLGERLDSAAGGPLAARIMALLDARIATPYLNEWFWWMGGRGQKTLNWTVWCTQNALYTLFLAPFDALTRQKALAKGLQSLQFFLDDYGEDGCCDEGAQYYRHAGLCLHGALALADEVCGGALAAVWNEPKLRNIAEYICNVHVAGEWYINFADCSPVAGRAGAREYLFGRRCQSRMLCDFAAADWVASQDKTLAGENNLFYRAQAAHTEAMLLAHRPGGDPKPADIYYASTGLFITRDDTWCLAVKAGRNDDNHNHNDVGSLTLYKNGQPLLIDVGVESYTAKTFSSRRYEIWTMQSSWHNLPHFDGVMQQAGRRYAARQVETECTPALGAIQMRLEGAWPPEARLARYSRRVALHKNRCVEMIDEYQGGFRQAELHLLTALPPQLKDGRLLVGDLASIEAEGAERITIEPVSVCDPRLRLAWPDTIWRITLPAGRRLHITIR